MKKFLSLLIAFIMCISTVAALVSCNTEDDKEDNTTEKIEAPTKDEDDTKKNKGENKTTEKSTDDSEDEEVGNPENPGDSEKPTEPEEPQQPTEPEQPSQPEEPTEPEQPAEPEKPVISYAEINSLSQLSDGEYFIGGYQDGQLYLATGQMTAQWHCVTAKYFFSQGNLTAMGEAAATIHLERAEEGNGYYIRFPNGQYLVAIGARAGALRLSDKKDNYWLFSEHPEGGFIVRQSGKIDVQIIISPTAPEALLRSIAGDEEGNGVVLFGQNK